MRCVLLLLHSGSLGLCPCLPQSFSLALLSSLSNPPSAGFYQILSQGASYKTNRAHQDWAPEGRCGQSSLIYHGPERAEASPGIYQTYQILSADLKDNVSTASHWEHFVPKRTAKRTQAAVLNQHSHPETLDKHTAPAFLSGLVGLWGRKVCA